MIPSFAQANYLGFFSCTFFPEPCKFVSKTVLTIFLPYDAISHDQEGLECWFRILSVQPEEGFLKNYNSSSRLIRNKGKIPH